MKQSLFNHIVKLPEGSFIIYNFFTAHIVKLNLFTIDCYHHPELYGKNHPVVKSLFEQGLLVDYDELRYLKKRVEEECYSRKRIGLVICPTLQCNFACPYCFETSRPGKMMPEVIEDTVSFVKKLLEGSSTNGIDVKWYGGEPLLEPGIIETLSEKLIALCEEMNIEYCACIVTNGYFLTKDKQDLFKKCKIKHAQVTIDGPDAQTHDATRHLKGGGATFDRIMDNIRNFDADCSIMVRCNVYKQNQALYWELEDKIHRMSEELHRKISVYSGFMSGEKTYIGKEISREDYVDILKKRFTHVKRYGYIGSVCTMPRSCSFVIDEKGNLYKCWESVGKDDEIIGNVQSFLPSRPNTGNMDLYMDIIESAWPGEDEECMRCALLPTCMGGCPVKRKKGKKLCHPIKYCTDEYVQKVYRGKNENG